MRALLDTFRFTRVAARPAGLFAIFDVPPKNAPSQYWDVASDAGVVGHAEIFEGADQWGVRFYDKLPELDESELLRIVAHLLTWEAGCRAETVDVVLARTRKSHVMVRVGGDYV